MVMTVVGSLLQCRILAISVVFKSKVSRDRLSKPRNCGMNSSNNACLTLSISTETFWRETLKTWPIDSCVAAFLRRIKNMTNATFASFSLLKDSRNDGVRANRSAKCSFVNPVESLMSIVVSSTDDSFFEIAKESMSSIWRALKSLMFA